MKLREPEIAKRAGREVRHIHRYVYTVSAVMLSLPSLLTTWFGEASLSGHPALVCKQRKAIASTDQLDHIAVVEGILKKIVVVLNLNTLLTLFKLDQPQYH